MQKPDFSTLGLPPEATNQDISTRMKEWLDYVESPELDLTVGEVATAMRGIILMAAALLANIVRHDFQNQASVSMILGSLAGEAMQGEMVLADRERARKAKLN